MTVTEVLTRRVSAAMLVPTPPLDPAEITELVRLAQEAPSAYNAQFTRYVAVTDPELKSALQEAAYGQAKIGAAGVVFVLLGDLQAGDAMIARLQAGAAAGAIPQERATRMEAMVRGAYADPAKAREEAIRSVGLSGMALMLAAEERGWATCPMIGFDRAKFSTILGLDARHEPLMVVVVGRPAEDNPPRKPRLSPADVLRFNADPF
jgi:nitroreductase